MMNPNINAANNRLSTTDGYLYDTAGNTTRDSQNRRFTYDAENKQTKVEQLDSNGGVTAVLGLYFYDGDGKRIKKIVPGTGEVTVFVYDVNGRTVAEYSTVVANTLDATVSYLTADHLGSPRVITDALGNVTSRRDFQPFGEEINAVAAVPTARTAAQNYTQPDNVRQKFTTYERDEEINLDYAQARMYGFDQARFTSPDPLAASANPARPQSWNRYSYSYNNPLRYTDPSGMIAGDFYNLKGEKIGTDGVNDGKIHIVTDGDKAAAIKKTKGAYEGDAGVTVTLPSAEVVTAIGEAVERSNNSTYDKSGLPELKNNLEVSESASGGFRETGVSWKTAADGTTTITVAPDGDYADPRDRDPITISMPSDSDGSAHVHASGQIETETKNGGGGVTYGGKGPTIANFRQPPSQLDIDGAGNRTRIVVGARDKTVYFYNSGGVLKQTMKLDNFMKLGKSK